MLVLMVIGVGVAVWTAVTEQRIELTETESLDRLERGATEQVGSLSINVEAGAGGPTPVVLLHDVDVAGGVTWDGVIRRFDDSLRPLSVDLPGFGLSERIPAPGTPHTVAAMAEVVAEIIDDRFDAPVVAAGVGLGGEVAAEIAVIQPDLIRAVVLIDVDFWGEARDWLGDLETFPWVGRAVVHTVEAGGRLGLERWAPHCEEGGWCPTPDQVFARQQAASVANTTDSIKAFRETPASSLVPSDLDEITVPVTFVWSTEGVVPAESVEMTAERLPRLSVIEVDAWDAHLDAPGEVARVIESVAG